MAGIDSLADTCTGSRHGENQSLESAHTEIQKANRVKRGKLYKV